MKILGGIFATLYLVFCITLLAILGISARVFGKLSFACETAFDWLGNHLLSTIGKRGERK
jgi:hypothetical protein